MMITSLGHFHPENRIDNAFFDQLNIGSKADWILERTGIEERRSVLTVKQLQKLHDDPSYFHELHQNNGIMKVAEMGRRAWSVAVERNSAISQGVDFVICGTSIPDFDVPANACSIAAATDLECAAVDINSACSSFVVDLHVARSMLQAKTASKVAIFVPERYTVRLDYKDRTSCVLFGDGCATAVIENDAGSKKALEVIDTIVISSPAKFDLVSIPDSGKFTQVGHSVQKFAITRTIEVTETMMQRHGLTPETVNYFIGHQANLRMLTSAMEKLKVPPAKHLFNVDQFGNQGGAGAPSVLSQNWEKFRKGDLIIVSVVGAGLTWASALLRCV